MKPTTASLAGILREHYASEAADAGLRSSWGPMVEMAKSGLLPGGRSTYEGAITARRHGWGGREKGETKNEATGAAILHRRARAALHAMKPRSRPSTVLRDALYLAYGPEAWPAVVEGAYGASGAPAVVLLTRAAARGFAKALERAGARRARLEANGIGEWLRSVAAREDAAFVAVVCTEAKGLLSDALDSFAEAWGVSRAPVVSGPRPRGVGLARVDLPGDSV